MAVFSNLMGVINKRTSVGCVHQFHDFLLLTNDRACTSRQCPDLVVLTLILVFVFRPWSWKAFCDIRWPAVMEEGKWPALACELCCLDTEHAVGSKSLRGRDIWFRGCHVHIFEVECPIESKSITRYNFMHISCFNRLGSSLLLSASRCAFSTRIWCFEVRSEVQNLS
jgi:hypothetical protein